jgi:hypothetical protein
MLGFNNAELEYHICTGTNPDENIARTPFLLLSLGQTDNYLYELGRTDPLRYGFNAIFILLPAVVIRIWIYSQGPMLYNFFSYLKTM